MPNELKYKVEHENGVNLPWEATSSFLMGERGLVCVPRAFRNRYDPPLLRLNFLGHPTECIEVARV